MTPKPNRPKRYTSQIIVRLSPELHAALTADAEANSRTVAGTVRHYLQRAVQS